jgi:hypothetical protein
MRVLESETAGHFEHGMKNHTATSRRRAKTPGDEQQKRLRFQGGNPFSL